MLLHHPIKKCDAIFILCSLDLRVAHYGAELYKRGLGDYLIISGNGRGRLTEHLFEKTEAETFADVAMEHGVPPDKIILETEATNTGENLRFVHTLLQQRGPLPKSLMLVQKPHMERRAYATFKQQWPESDTSFVVASPPIAYEDYFDETSPRCYVIEVLVGSLQRIKVYAERGFQIPQPIPPKVWHAYEALVAAGFTGQLLVP